MVIVIIMMGMMLMKNDNDYCDNIIPRIDVLMQKDDVLHQGVFKIWNHIIIIKIMIRHKNYDDDDEDEDDDDDDGDVGDVGLWKRISPWF